MDRNRSEKLKNTIISFIFVSLFLGSLFILVNDRFHLINKFVDPMDNPNQVIKIIGKDTQWSYIEEGKIQG